MKRFTYTTCLYIVTALLFSGSIIVSNDAAAGRQVPIQPADPALESPMFPLLDELGDPFGRKIWPTPEEPVVDIDPDPFDGKDPFAPAPPAPPTRCEKIYSDEIQNCMGGEDNTVEDMTDCLEDAIDNFDTCRDPAKRTPFDDHLPGIRDSRDPYN